MSVRALLVLVGMLGAVAANAAEPESPWLVATEAIPAEPLVEGVGRSDAVHVAVVPPPQPELASIAGRLGRATRDAVAAGTGGASVISVRQDALDPNASDDDVVTARLAKGASRVLIVRVYPPESQGGVPRVLFSMYSRPGAPDAVQVSLKVLVPRQRAVEKGMARIFADPDSDEDKPKEKEPLPPPKPRAKEKDDDKEDEEEDDDDDAADDDKRTTAPPPRGRRDVQQARLLEKFKQRALTVRIVPARENDSGADEYRVQRGGKDLSTDELDELQLLEVDAAVGSTGASALQSRWVRALPALGGAAFPVGCGLTTLICCGGGCALWTLASAFLAQWPSEDVVPNLICYTFMGSLLAIPATAIGVIPGLASLAAGAIGFATGGGGTHPYLKTVADENRRLARSLGLDPARAGKKYFPD